MNFGEVKDSFFRESSSFANHIAQKLSETDPLLVVVAGLIVTVVVTAIAVVLLRAVASEADVTAALKSNLPDGADIVLRDLNSRISSLASQVKDEQLFVKQELCEIKLMFTELNDYRILENQMQSLNNRISSYSNLMRDEVSGLREDINQVKRLLGTPGSTPKADKVRKAVDQRINPVGAQSGQPLIHEGVSRDFIFGEE